MHRLRFARETVTNWNGPRQGLANRWIEAAAFDCDVTDLDQVNRAIGQATERFGGIDILVNNAGVIQVGPVTDTTLVDFEHAMDVMFWGPCMRRWAVLPGMRQRGEGRIVNVTSIGGKVSVPHLVPYSCAKFAATAFSEGLRPQWPEWDQGGYDHPGLMRTGSHFQAYFKGQYKKEYTWFTPGAATPLLSISAERAAREIVNATRRGNAEKILSIPADLLARFHGLFPELTARILEIVKIRCFQILQAIGAQSRPGTRRTHRSRHACWMPQRSWEGARRRD